MSSRPSIPGDSSQDTYDREDGTLRKLNAFQPLKRMVIVTYDEEATIDIAGDQAIEVIPAWKWLFE